MFLLYMAELEEAKR